MRLTYLLPLVVVGGCVIDDNTPATLMVRNQSSVEITQLFVTGVGHRSWGSNLLVRPLQANDEISIDVGCGTYDALLVDATGSQCELDAIDLCFSDATWLITDATCAVFAK